MISQSLPMASRTARQRSFLRDFRAMCRIETSVCVVGVSGSPRGRPHNDRRQFLWRST